MQILSTALDFVLGVLTEKVLLGDTSVFVALEFPRSWTSHKPVGMIFPEDDKAGTTCTLEEGSTIDLQCSSAIYYLGDPGLIA